MEDIIPFNHFKCIAPSTIPFLEIYLEEIVASKFSCYKEHIVVREFWSLIQTRRMRWGNGGNWKETGWSARIWFQVSTFNAVQHDLIPSFLLDFHSFYASFPSLFSSQAGLCVVSWICQLCCVLWTFAFAILSTWNTIPKIPPRLSLGPS